MFLVLNGEGQVELEIASDSMADAKRAIDRAFPKHTRIFTLTDPTIDAIEEHAPKGRADNPPGNMADHAMKISGLPWDPVRRVGITLAEVEALYPLTQEGLVKAHRALLPYFPNRPSDFGYKQWHQPAKMARSLLKTNTKTKKAVKGFAGAKIPPSYAVGINVLPFALGAMLSATPKDVQEREYLSDPKNAARPVQFRRLPFVTQKHNGPGTREMDWSPDRMQGLCAGSTKECRRSCLVYTGQNGAVAYNDISKMQTERALFFEPLAFARMLIEAIEKHYERCRKARLKPFVRLNVYSDIPWELFFPDLFRHFEKKYGHDVNKGGLWFYDYTKVTGRGPRPMPNYDLTFSYSGGNLPAVKEALASGMRVAVVFVRATATGSQKPMFRVEPLSGRGESKNVSATSKKTAIDAYRKEHPGRAELRVTKVRAATYQPAETVEDLVFEGYPVIDGDPYDMRPLDPGGVVVGLRFKVPKRVSSGEKRQDAIKSAGSFLLEPPRADERFLVHCERLNGEWAYRAVTPRDTNVDLASQLNEQTSPQAAE